MSDPVSLLALPARLLAHPDSTVATYPGRAPRTYRQLHGDLTALAGALRARGVRPGMRLGIWMRNSYEWLVADLALLELRCVSVALPDELAKDHLTSEVERLGLHGVLCDPGQGPALPWVWAVGEHERFAPRQVELEACADLEVPAWTFSSGTTGRLRCIETDRRGVEALVTIIRDTFEVGASDRFLVFLPMASFQQRFLLYATLWQGVQLAITEPKHLLPAMKAHAPTVLIAPPSLFEALAGRVAAMPPWRRALVAGALAVSSVLPGALRARLRRALGRRLGDALGGSTRLRISGMAPISRETLRTFARLGLPITEVYGMTECGMIAWNTPRAHRMGAVGRPLGDAEVTLAEDGEVLVRRAVQPTRRYLFEPVEAADSATYRGGGTIATGDLGRLDADGYLYLTGRKKNVIVSSTGEKLSPEPLEAELRAIPAVEHAVFVQRAGRLALVCRIEPDADRDAVTRGVAAKLHRAVGGLAAAELVVTSEPFTVASGLVTPNLKVRRDAVAARVLGGEATREAR